MCVCMYVCMLVNKRCHCGSSFLNGLRFAAVKIAMVAVQ